MQKYCPFPDGRFWCDLTDLSNRVWGWDLSQKVEYPPWGETATVIVIGVARRRKAEVGFVSQAPQVHEAKVPRSLI